MTGYTLDYLRGERDRLQERLNEEQANLHFANVREENARQQIDAIKVAYDDVIDSIAKLEKG